MILPAALLERPLSTQYTEVEIPVASGASTVYVLHLEIPLTPVLIHTEYQSLSWNDKISCEKIGFNWRSFSCGVQQVETGVAISNGQGYNWTCYSTLKYLSYALSISVSVKYIFTMTKWRTQGAVQLTLLDSAAEYFRRKKLLICSSWLHGMLVFKAFLCKEGIDALQWMWRKWQRLETMQHAEERSVSV